MIVWLLMTVLTDALFESAAGTQRTCTDDFTRYLRRRGFKPRRSITTSRV